MKVYILKKVIVTEPSKSVDGKRHQTTNYFKGVDEICGFGCSVWGTGRKGAVTYPTKAAARKFAKRFGAEVVEITI